MLKKYYLILTFLVLIVLTGCGKQSSFIVIQKNINDNQNLINNDTDNNTAGENTTTATNDIINNGDTPTVVEIPAKLDLGAPFVSQAPLHNWEMPYQEFCEEAAMLSVAKYFSQTAIDSQTINQELLALAAWEQANSYPIDLTAAGAVEILEQYFNLNAWQEREVSVDRIKYELSRVHLIIIPTAGRLLGNPYFTGDGPIYHMLVIRGYDEKNFITNDVGTNTKGEKYKYSYQTILNSIHNWNHQLAEDGMTDEEIQTGEKVMIVISNN